MGNLLFIAIMYSDEANFNKAKDELVEKYGNIKAESDSYDFNFTKYYEKEMGSDLKKKFIVFKKEISKEDLTEIKFFITEIEEKFSEKESPQLALRTENLPTSSSKQACPTPRTVNIDPGYLSSTELVLATWKGKDFKEKISEKVWVHKVLEFNGEIKEFFHTFADYKIKENQEFIVNNKD